MSDVVRFSDGQAALRAALDFRTNANSEIVCGVPASPSTLRLLTGAVQAAGRTVRFIDLDSPGALTAAINRRTRVVLVEPGAGDDLRVPAFDPIVDTLHAVNEDRFEEERAVLVVRSSTALPPPAPDDRPAALLVHADGAVFGDPALIATLRAHQEMAGGRPPECEPEPENQHRDATHATEMATAIANDVSGHAALAAVHRRAAFPSVLVLEFAGDAAAARAARFADALGVARPDAGDDARTGVVLGRSPECVRLEAGPALSSDQVRQALDATL
jgi:hypothetical protein